jgi:tRNA(fMet)-specific endonuclease VapC
MKSVILDTSALIEFLERRGRLSDSLRGFDRLVVPAAVDAEFRAGLDPDTKSGRERAALLDELLADPSVEFAPAGRSESGKYAQLYRYLKSNGTPIPLHDIWIAATALVRDAAVCSNDGHFKNVPLLRRVATTA